MKFSKASEALAALRNPETSETDRNDARNYCVNVCKLSRSFVLNHEDEALAAQLVTA